MPKRIRRFDPTKVIPGPMATETYPKNSHTDAEEIDNLFAYAPSNSFVESLHEWWMEKGFLTEEQFGRLKDMSGFIDTAEKFNRFDKG